MTVATPAYKRILLKLSGEALMGDDAFGINRSTIVRMVQEVAEVTRMGVEVAVVIGGGNIFRGVAGGAEGMDRATADYMGMLATVMNALALADAMDKQGLTARVMSAIAIDQAVKPTCSDAFEPTFAITMFAHGVHHISACAPMPCEDVDERQRMLQVGIHHHHHIARGRF